MEFMLCRNRVADYEKWKSVFDSYASAHKAAGLHLVNIWRTIGDSDNVFFLFRLETIEKARAFINAPGAAEVGKRSGVIDGEYHFIDAGGGYDA